MMGNTTRTPIKTAAGLVLAFCTGMLLSSMLSGCTSTKYVPVESVRTEYKDNVREAHIVDSVIDTRFVYVKGDTVIDWRDKVKWRERIVHDSIYIERTDSVQIPYPVEKPLTRWQQAKMDFGGMAIGAVGLVLIFLIVWAARKLSK